MNPRSLAATCLARLERARKENLRAVDLLDAIHREHPDADPRDRGLLTELVYGVLRWHVRLDHTLAGWVKQRFTKLEPIARSLLRVGAYQLVMLDRIPDRAAVHATLEAADAIGASRVKGLVNAVLRRVAENGEQLPTGYTDNAIAVRTSLPRWIVRELRYLSRSPEELEALAAGLRRRPALTVRPTLTRGGADAVRAALQKEGFVVADGAYGTLEVSGPGDPFGTAAARGGLFVAQDPASLAVIDLCGDVAGKRVLDLCAGRGIKATALADRGAEVMAVDLVASKLEQTRALAQRLGLGHRIETCAIDPTRQALDVAPFDVVLVDAPCTGLGTLARRPEIAWRREPADIKRLARLQNALLDQGARYVTSKGIVVYAVCTFTKAESAPGVPEGFISDPGRDVHRWRPDQGSDAFYARRFQRVT